MLGFWRNGRNGQNSAAKSPTTPNPPRKNSTQDPKTSKSSSPLPVQRARSSLDFPSSSHLGSPTLSHSSPPQLTSPGVYRRRLQPTPSPKRIIPKISLNEETIGEREHLEKHKKHLEDTNILLKKVQLTSRDMTHLLKYYDRVPQEAIREMEETGRIATITLIWSEIHIANLDAKIKEEEKKPHERQHNHELFKESYETILAQSQHRLPQNSLEKIKEQCERKYEKDKKNYFTYLLKDKIYSAFPRNQLTMDEWKNHYETVLEEGKGKVPEDILKSMRTQCEERYRNHIHAKLTGQLYSKIEDALFERERDALRQKLYRDPFGKEFDDPRPKPRHEAWKACFEEVLKQEQANTGEDVLHSVREKCEEQYNHYKIEYEQCVALDNQRSPYRNGFGY